MSNLPILVMLAGLPGTGKSTIAQQVANQLGFLILDKDIINTVLLDAGMPQSEAGFLAYEITLKLAEDVLIRQKQSIILDTAGRQPFILERAQAMTTVARANLVVVWFRASSAIRMARMARRQALPSQWRGDQTTEAQEQQWYGHLPSDTLVVNTGQPEMQVVKTVLALLYARIGS